jgi:hypothetical protein
MGEKKNTYMIVVRKPGGKRPLGRQKGRLGDDTKMDFREIRWGGMDSIHPG